MSNEHYLEGVRCARAFYYSGHYGGLDQNIRAEDAIKLFLPPVNEAMNLFQTPMPKPRKDWIKGFKEEQAAILAELENDTGPGIPSS